MLPDTSDSLRVQLSVLGDQRKGEIHTMMNIIITPAFTDTRTQLYMNEVVLGTLFGVVLGPHVFNIFNPRSWTGITDILTREVMRVVLGTGLFAIGVELPKRYMAEHAKSLAIMVVPTMAFGWIVSAGKRASVRMIYGTPPLTLSIQAFIHVLFPKLDFVSSLVISACLTPTDPIISAAVIGQSAVMQSMLSYCSAPIVIVHLAPFVSIGGKFAVQNVPLPIRQILIAESAANDGLAYPFLSISIYLATEASRATAFEKWVVIGWLCTQQIYHLFYSSDCL